MKPPMSLYIMWVLAIVALPAMGQIEDLTRDASFFQQQTRVYQKWLDHSGMGSLLRVREVGVSPNRLTLYLEFTQTDVSAAVQAWWQLKSSFDSQQPISLEQQLFYKMTALMEVEQHQADIQLFDSYSPQRGPLFYRRVYFNFGHVQVEESNPLIKAPYQGYGPTNLQGLRTGEHMQVSLAEIRAAENQRANDQVYAITQMKRVERVLPLQAGNMSVEDFHRVFTSDRVYNMIYEYAEARYEVQTCYNRFPEVELLENGELLRFEVIDLCKEVLIDERENGIICSWLRRLGFPCNWIKRELLIFTIKYAPTSTGINLNIEIDGKFGSGLYKNVRRGGYHSMEVDFDDYLERYTAKFVVDLKKALLYGKRY